MLIDKDKVINNDELLEEVKENDKKPSKELIESVIKLNQYFSFYYKDLWLKDAEDEGYLDLWVDEFVKEKIKPETIVESIEAVKKDSRFETYPPNFSQFLDICKKQSKVYYNLPTKEEAYMIACGKRDINLNQAHAVVRETVRRVESFRIKSDPSIKHEFYRVYNEVCSEFNENDGNVNFNDKISIMSDFSENEEPPVSREEAKSYLRKILEK